MLARIASPLLTVLLWPVRVARHRRVLAALAAIDDRGLADIGLTRQDLRDATALPLDADPSLPLARRAAEREALARRARPGRLAAE